MDEKKESKNSFWKRLKWILTVAFISVVAAAIFWWLKMQKPAVSRDIRVIETPAEEVKKAPEKERFDGKYFSIEKLETFKLKKHEKFDAPEERILESVFFAEAGVNSKKIAVTVSRSGSNNLEDVPDYKIRQIYRDKYKKGEFRGEGVKAETFSVNEASYFEKVYFITEKESLAVVAFTAPMAKSPELEQEADEIAGSFTW